MDGFFEVKFIVRILYFITLFAMFEVEAAVKIECIKSDECSCKTNTTTQQQEISLWPMPSGNGIVLATGSPSWLFDINLCHGLNKNTDAPDGGCQNATVCQYLDLNKKETFEIGQFGNVTFGQYDNDTKSITLQYYGILQEKTTRSITITLKCNENGNITKAVYNDIKRSLFNENEFITTIKTKAACFRPVVVPNPTSRSNITSSGGLKTLYIVLIALAGFAIVLAIGLVGYKMFTKRKRGLLIEEEENEDYGTVPRAHVQNALSAPVSGPV